MDRPVRQRLGGVSMPGSHGGTILADLPECLVVDETLAWLPVKDVLCCRAVCKSWRSGTSTDEFILNHHRRQPSLPIIKHIQDISRVVQGFSDRKVKPILQYREFRPIFHHATCDGLLILSLSESKFYVCSPATHKCASLPHPPHSKDVVVRVAGFYRHQTSREYRVLWLSYPTPARRNAEGGSFDYLILTVGSDQPRCIQSSTFFEQRLNLSYYGCPPVHHRGSLHWTMGPTITVFDTRAEIFRKMRRPTQLGDMVPLIDMCGTLALCHLTQDHASLDVWVLRDYDAETWGFQYRINLRLMEASPPLNFEAGLFSTPKMDVINEHELLIEHTSKRLLHCDIDGVFLGNVERKENENRFALITRHHLQESMVSLPLFETHKRAGNKKLPFDIVL